MFNATVFPLSNSLSQGSNFHPPSPLAIYNDYSDKKFLGDAPQPTGYWLPFPESMGV
jgi:hypothetical protein